MFAADIRMVSVPIIGIWVWRARGLEPIVYGDFRVVFGKGHNFFERSLLARKNRSG